MQLRAIQLSYLLGISLVLTGIIYFFAANWGYFGRIEKIGLSISLLILFYLLHFLLKKVFKYKTFLSNLSLFAASIIFGVAVALIGQTYNSHADSYQLFFIWLISVLALALITKYTPFYVLSFILGNLTMLFFVFPFSYMPDWSSHTLLIFLSLIGLTNVALFFITYNKWLNSKTILYLAYIMLFSIFFYIAASETLPYHIALNIINALLLLIAGYYFLKIKQNKSLFTITVIFAAVFILYRVLYWVVQQDADWVLYALLAIAVFLTLASVIVVSILNRNKMNHFLSNILVIAATIIATLFATVAITGIFFLIIPDATTDALYFFAILALIIPGLLLVKFSDQIRYTLLGTGFIIAFISTVFEEKILYQYIILILLCVSVYIVKTKGIKVLLYLFANTVAYLLILQDFSIEVMYLIMFTLNLLYFIFLQKEKATNNTAFVMALLSFMGLTFLELPIWLQITYNLTFFISLSAMILLLDRTRHTFKWTVSLVLWFVFIAYNYYEYLWTLIHKSIIAIIIGVIFIIFAAYLERRTGKLQPESKPISYKTPLLITIAILQIGFIGVQSFTSEKLLTDGELIKLELQPLDSRSLLQGDYFIINYEINDLKIEENGWNEKIKVLLREKDGIYDYAGNYKIDNVWHKDYQKEPGDVIINGTIQGSDYVVYGIESYFVEEDTGQELQNSVEYGYVRVGKSGNAILEKVE